MVGEDFFRAQVWLKILNFSIWGFRSGISGSKVYSVWVCNSKSLPSMIVIVVLMFVIMVIIASMLVVFVVW